MSRRVIISGNWKMNKDSAGAAELVKGLLSDINNMPSGREMIIFPPAIYLKEVAAMAKGSKIKIGAQNMYFKADGAFTGENSPKMVKDAGAEYILIGHSERRHVFGENDQLINQKVKAAYEFGLLPMLCIGELLEEFKAGKSKDVCKTQLVEGLKGVTADQMKSLVVAYEPVWAIGTGEVATPEIAEDIHKFCREVLTDLYGKEISSVVPILYGGSVKADNAAGLLSKENVDGALVGGACLEKSSFMGIAKA